MFSPENKVGEKPQAQINLNVLKFQAIPKTHTFA